MLSSMKIRLSVASLGVAGLAYIFGPLSMIAVMVLVGVAVGHSARCSGNVSPSLYPPTDTDE